MSGVERKYVSTISVSKMGILTNNADVVTLALNEAHDRASQSLGGKPYEVLAQTVTSIQLPTGIEIIASLTFVPHKTVID